ncbi:MAG: PKD domain-containing protein [bacterium]
MRYKLCSLIILCFLGAGFFASAQEPAKLLISQIQITGGEGLTTNDFVKIYNPNDFDADLQGYRLVKRTKTGISDTSIKSWSNETLIPAKSYHIWANSKDGFAESIEAGSSTTQTISADNGIAIRFGPEDEGQIIDSLGWGECENEFVEASVFPINPEANQILTRRDNIDTDNNASDFALLKDEAEQEIIKETPAPSYGGTPAQNEEEIEEEEIEQEPETLIQPKIDKIYISEILPNPLGIDQPDCLACGEFIELYNAGEEPVDLKGWQIKADQQQIFTINHFLPLYPNDRLIFYRYQTGLILKNKSGELRLYMPDNSKAKQLIKYKDALENTSYNLMPDLKTWQWSKLISPSKDNTVNYQPIAEFYAPDTSEVNEKIIFDASDSYDQDNDVMSFSWDFGDENNSNEKNPTHIFTQPGKYTVYLTVDDKINQSAKKQTIEIKGEELIKKENIAEPTQNLEEPAPPVISDNRLRVKGVVIALPGVFGIQFFYILPMQEQGTLENSAIQIYSYNKTFPALAIGDYIEVAGELSDIQTETRIKIKQANDIQILEHDYIVIEREISCDQINEHMIGQLVSVMGKVIDKQGSNVFLYDGSAEAVIYLNKGANINTLNLNESFKIIGLVRQTKTGIKIMPRSMDDIIPLNLNEPEPEILGEKVVENQSDTIFIPSRDNKQKLMEYLLIIAGAVIIGLLIYTIKLQKKRP